MSNIDNDPAREQVSEQQLVGLLLSFLPYKTPGAGSRLALARKLAAELPDEWRYRDVLEGNDQRVFVNWALDNVDTLTADETSALESSRDTIAMRVRELHEAALGAQTPIDPVDQGRFAQSIPGAVSDLLRRGETELVALPRDGDDDDGPRASESGSADVDALADRMRLDDFTGVFDAPDAESTQTPLRFLSKNEVRLLFETSLNPIDDLEDRREQDMLLALQRDQAGDTVEGTATRVQVLADTSSIPIPGTLGLGTSVTPEDLGRYSNRGSYTINETLQLPSSMSRNELMRLQFRMRQAGLFDNGEPTIPGDATDTRFKYAWRQLIAQSLETGRPITEVLSSRQIDLLRAENSELDQALNVQLSDPAAIRQSSDQLGTGTLGRRLSDDEHAAVVEFVHNLEQQNARYDAAQRQRAEDAADPNAGRLNELVELDPNDTSRFGSKFDAEFNDNDRRASQIVEEMMAGEPEAQAAPDVRADIAARMQEWVRNDNPVEAESHDAADQYDAFRRLLAGPGRPGGQ